MGRGKRWRQHETDRRHDIEGAILDVPLRYDARAQMDIEEYPDLIKYPLYTPRRGESYANHRRCL